MFIKVIVGNERHGENLLAGEDLTSKIYLHFLNTVSDKNGWYYDLFLCSFTLFLYTEKMSFLYNWQGQLDYIEVKRVAPELESYD